MSSSETATALVREFRAARRSGTPLISVESLDQHATIAELKAVAGSRAPCYRWDIAAGITPLNELAAADIIDIVGNADQFSEQTRFPVQALEFATKMRKRSVLFFCNAQAYLNTDAVRNDPVPAQQVSNLRDEFKRNLRTLVLLGPCLSLDQIIKSDVIGIDSPLPDEGALRGIVSDQMSAVELEPQSEDVMSQAVTSVKGLSHFGAEQTIAMSLSKEAVDLDFLGRLQRKTISKIDGLSMDLDSVTFDDIGGQSQIRKFVDGLFMGEHPYKLVIRIDEIEKMLGGSGGTPGQSADTSGVGQDALGVLLRVMEDNRWSGMIGVGAGGSGKSLLTKAIGATYGVRTLAVDIGAMKGSLVGESERKIREAFNVVESLGGSDVLVVATCNRLNTLPPELKRRFTYGIWYFDLPTEDERDKIWKLHQSENYPKSARPDDRMWTGAEIRNCCELAYRLKIAPKEAAQYIVPIAKSDPEGLESLRSQANGRFLSVSQPGPYRKDGGDDKKPKGRMRDDEE